MWDQDETEAESGYESKKPEWERSTARHPPGD